jgi:hypothetical protein
MPQVPERKIIGHGEKCPISEVAAVSENVCSTPDNHRQLEGVFDPLQKFQRTGVIQAALPG